MSKFTTFCGMITHPYRFVWPMGCKGILGWMSDKTYLRLIFRDQIGYFYDFEHPRTYNEKLQWLKVYNRRPEYTKMVDKYQVREYVSEKIGSEYLIPLLGVWDHPDQIDFDQLPDQFVLKCNHTSGLGNCICKDKSKLNLALVKKQLQKGLQTDYFSYSREWPYKDVPRKIICEKFMEDATPSEGLTDYKFMCFNGKVECLFTCDDRFSSSGMKLTFYDRDWNILPFERGYPKSSVPQKKPRSLEQMISCAEKLSEGIPFVRVDFYDIDDRVYFGEMTFFPGGGLEAFSPESVDLELGKLIELPSKYSGK